MENSIGNTISASQREHYAVLACAGYLSYLKDLAILGDDFGDSLEAENLINESARLSSKAMLFDVCEEDSWADYTNRATLDEICKFCVMKLKEEFLTDQKDPVYAAVASENGHGAFLSKINIERMDLSSSLKESIFELEINKGIRNEETLLAIYRII